MSEGMHTQVAGKQTDTHNWRIQLLDKLKNTTFSKDMVYEHIQLKQKFLIMGKNTRKKYVFTHINK